ncbi:MAG: 4-amino-4-deoxy-L-arabinose transferase [Aeromicrobium sp.]|uniref:4-amino-4-deoxy-L-arabinose transferase n=1 Tax=Aeromicrobium sp. TaxID=1871063 RepID=UPI0039E388CF
MIAERLTEPHAIVLLDGRSGTGKSHLADEVVVLVHEARLVRMDDLYPGWDGLDAAIQAVAHDLLAPLAAGRPGRWRAYDWHAARLTDWHTVEPGAPLLIEGVGSLSRLSAPSATWRVWLEAEERVRRERALSRSLDGALFAPQWDRWAAQEDAFIAAHDSARLADLVADTGCRS